MPAVLVPAGRKDGPGVGAGTLWLPRVGAWLADLTIDSATVPSGRHELQLSDRHVLVGTVSRAGAVGDGQRTRLRLVAGAAGLLKQARPQHYTSPTLAVVLRDLLRNAGEVLSPSAERAVLVHQLAHWTTIAMPAAQAVRLLLSAAGPDVAWRHLPDGQVWVGRETWPDSKVRDFTELAREPESDTYEVAVPTPDLLPGTLLGGRRVDTVEIRMSGGSIRATVWTVP